MAKLQNVNSTDILDAIRLGCRTMANVFNADDGDIPFFRSVVRPEARLSFNSSFSDAHVPGRHLNALLNAEAVGIDIDGDAVKKHERAAFFSYSGALPLPLNREEIGGPLVNFRAHNVREGFHALYALAQYRDSARARELAEASIAAIFEYWDPMRGWDGERLAREHGLDLQPEQSFVAGLARAIGPLTKYYRATGYGPALELAIVLKEKAVSEFFLTDGSYDPARLGTHTHSTTCVMSSLAQLADLLGDTRLMDRTKAFYDRGLWAIRDALGWVIERSRPDAPADRGEANNTGDILETALILGHWGHAEAYQDAERILRGHLLPCQLRDISFIVDPPNPRDEDGLRAVATRHLGAFGFPAPYGHQPLGVERVSFNMDIVGGAVGSLCDAYREVTRCNAAGHWVNLLFDHETEAIKVESPYTQRALTVTLKQPGALFVRVPSWAPAGGVSVEGVVAPARCAGDHLLLAEPPVGRPITIAFPLPEREMTLRHRTQDIRVRLRGDAVVAMDSFGTDLTYFAPID